MSTFSGDKLLLKLLTMRPAAKIFSDSTEVAGTHSSCLASWATIGKRHSFLLYHSKASSSGCSCGSLMKQSTSLVGSTSVAMPSRNDIAVPFLFFLGGASFFPFHWFASRDHVLHLLAKDVLHLWLLHRGEASYAAVTRIHCCCKYSHVVLVKLKPA